MLTEFKIKRSIIFKLAQARQSLIGRFSFVSKKPLFWLTVVFFFLSLFLAEYRILFLGLTIFSFSSAIIFWQISFFLVLKSEKVSVKKSLEQVIVNPENYNLADFFDLSSAQVIKRAIDQKTKSSNSLFKSFLDDKLIRNFIFIRMDFSLQELERNLSESLIVDDFDQVIIESLRKASQRNKKRATMGDILVSLAEINPFFKKLLFDNSYEPQDVANLVYWLEEIIEKENQRSRFWEWNNLIKKGSLARDWAFGYTVVLDKFSKDYTSLFRRTGFPDVIGHEKEIDEMERVLARKEINNVLLIGERGVGKEAMIHELARKSFNGQSLPEVNYQRVVELDLSFLLAQTKNNEEVEKTLDTIFNEVVFSGNIILVVSDFENFIGIKQEPGKIDISGVLSSYLHLPQFQIVALTDWVGYRKNIEKTSSINSLFEKIEILETSEQETLALLQRKSLSLERKYGIIVSYSALKSIVSYSDKYLPSVPFPKKALDVLDESVIYLSQNKQTKLLPEHVADIISRKVNVPVGEMSSQEKETLVNLENLMHQRIVNQEQAVTEVASALRRARTEVSQKEKPMGSFLFLGPTGVGKTETAKALASCYFGSESKIVRIDMSEFQSLNDIPRLVGSPEYEGFLTTKVRENPFSLILLDEIEKSHPDILNIFLQVLDEGYLNDGFGRKVDFKNTIIISTSNAGSQLIMDNIDGNKDWSQLKGTLLKNLFQKNVFRPEFINRFDAVVLFKPLTQENLLEIVRLLLKQTVQAMEEKGISLVIDEQLEKALISVAYDPKFGARELKRTIQDKVENSLASAILSNEIKKGDRVKIDPVSFKVELLTF
jgi:ATP-dependent Clp protease ATP-binding subunit ClpC